jgi:hypothetical protein
MQRLAVLIALALVALLIGCSGGTEAPDTTAGPRAPGSPPDQNTERSTAIHLTSGRWDVMVSLEVGRAGPLRFGLSRTRMPTGAEPHPLLQHEVVIRNEGPRRMTLDDTRGSGFLDPHKPPRLLGADEGCGYALDDGGPIEPGACRVDLRIVELPPGRPTMRTITLWHGLPGMEPLIAGTYRMPEVVRYRSEGDGDRSHTVDLGLTYRMRFTGRERDA